MKRKQKFRKHNFVSYIDETVSLDADLMMIAVLCEAASEDVINGASVLNWAGEMIQKHLNQQRVLRHKHFDEPLDFRTKGFLETERERLKPKRKEPVKKKRGRK